MKRAVIGIVLVATALLAALGASAAATTAETAASAPLAAERSAVPMMKTAPTPEQPSPEQIEAERVLAALRATYRHLDDVTVTFGSTPKGHQAIAYYTEGRIVINPDHTASVGDIMRHEVWHVIDWRDNATLDWGEKLPPQEASEYLR